MFQLITCEENVKLLSQGHTQCILAAGFLGIRDLELTKLSQALKVGNLDLSSGVSEP